MGYGVGACAYLCIHVTIEGAVCDYMGQGFSYVVGMDGKKIKDGGGDEFGGI